MTCNKLEFEFCKERRQIFGVVVCACIVLLLCKYNVLLSHQYNNLGPNTESKQNNLLASDGSKLPYPTFKLKLNKGEIQPTASNRTTQNILTRVKTHSDSFVYVFLV